ncbi:tRNA(Ile)(2)-agmatinylcytidine synthase [Halegenticoccus soli]|uniref:tRNA(Ile)(2)-agmatinylcytidine synthase n=1 Tax=Halegenticoccus soli TaxID=1985678 RepID=UPI000C6E1D5A|nr:tRNA(Ile)(2)-agmatinylcytidine synthase [Halegenticoccus soli]
MTVIGLDDTDSREGGMCTTYVAVRVAEAVREAGGRVDDLLLVRLNPAVRHKTRGNAALAVHTDLDADVAFDLARRELDRFAVADDPRTSPGLVVAEGDPAAVRDEIADFARRAVRGHHSIADAVALSDAVGYRHRGWKEGRGRIGALAAVGAEAAFDDWTYEHISYRTLDRCGTPREVDAESVFAAADEGYPAVWDTVDRGEGEAVCVPHTPCPILYGVRGDDPDAVRAVADGIEGEPVERTALFRTNQGTDAHLRRGTLDPSADGPDPDGRAADGDGADSEPVPVEDGGAYRLTGTVSTAPETRPGGHVFLALSADGRELRCVAFEPTKHFRDRVRALRPGDRVTVCGEVREGTLKLEKFAVRDLVRTELATPECPDCGRSMKSAGRDQGYRCRRCGTRADGREAVPLDRDLDLGWYEVPPCARRHIAKPLVRGGFDAAVHPER